MPRYVATDLSTLHPTAVDGPLFGLAPQAPSVVVRVRSLEVQLHAPNPGQAALLGLKRGHWSGGSGVAGNGNVGMPRDPGAPTTLTTSVRALDAASTWTIDTANPAGALRRISVPPAMGAWFRWTWPEGQGLVVDGQASGGSILSVVNLGTTDPGACVFTWTWEE